MWRSTPATLAGAGVAALAAVGVGWFLHRYIAGEAEERVSDAEKYILSCLAVVDSNLHHMRHDAREEVAAHGDEPLRDLDDSAVAILLEAGAAWDPSDPSKNPLRGVPWRRELLVTAETAVRRFEGHRQRVAALVADGEALLDQISSIAIRDADGLPADRVEPLLARRRKATADCLAVVRTVSALCDPAATSAQFWGRAAAAARDAHSWSLHAGAGAGDDASGGDGDGDDDDDAGSGDAAGGAA